MSQITEAIDDCNQRFDDLCRFIRNSDASDVSEAEAGKLGKGFLKARGIAQGSLAGVEVMDQRALVKARTMTKRKIRNLKLAG